MNVIRHSSLTARVAAAVALAAVASFAPQAAPAQGVAVIVNGQTMSFDQPPIVQTGRVFVPLRGVFENLGASVVYAGGQINATGRGRTVSLTIGSTHAIVDGQPVTIDVAPFIVGARTMVPLRFIAQSLGATVDWNDTTSTVTIASGRGGHQYPGRNPVTLGYQWPTGTIYNRSPQIRFQTSLPVAIGGFQVLVDGRDVTAGVRSNGRYFFATTPFALPAGSHRVRVRGRTTGGVPFDLSWTFYQASY